jgi:hypothetical protein
MTLHPITTNHSNTIGLCELTLSKNDKYIGKFKASLLKEWAEQVLHDLGDRQVYLYCHKSENPGTSAKSLAASIDYKDDLFVVVVGVEDREDMKED